MSNASQRINTIAGALVVLPPLLSLVTTAFVLGIGGRNVISGVMSVGSLVAFQTLFTQFNRPFGDLVGLGSSMQTLRAELARLDDVEQHRVDPVFEPKPGGLAIAHEPGNPARRPPPDRLSGRLELRNVSFGFNRASDAPLISQFSLTIEPGRRVALVGPSGSGKSTIGRLAAGLLQPWEGEILYDGFAIDEVSRDLFTDQVGMVDDQTLLFNGTIRENLTLWDDAVTDHEMIGPATDASIHGDIVRLRNGYSARLSEGARNLSGGQRQRMEIARTLIKNPALLILDEATSALDPVTEAAVDDNIRRRGCTCLIIAHRLSTIRDCDEIIVLQEGKVIERGSHDELMSRPGGSYARLQNGQDGPSAIEGGLPEMLRRERAEPSGFSRDSSVGVSLSPFTSNGHMNEVPQSHIDTPRTDARREYRRRQKAAIVFSALSRLSLQGTVQTARAAPLILGTAESRSNDLLVAACRAVGAAQGIEVKSLQLEGADDPLRLIARASRFRTRRVKLAPRWWMAEGAPMLGRRADGGPAGCLGSRLVPPLSSRRSRQQYQGSHYRSGRERIAANRHRVLPDFATNSDLSERFAPLRKARGPA